jgi:hypothetical protein
MRAMILLGGIPSESPLVLLVDALKELGADYRLFSQRKCAECAIDLRVEPGGVDGRLCLHGETLACAISAQSIFA